MTPNREVASEIARANGNAVIDDGKIPARSARGKTCKLEVAGKLSAGREWACASPGPRVLVVEGYALACVAPRRRHQPAGSLPHPEAEDGAVGLQDERGSEPRPDTPAQRRGGSASGRRKRTTIRPAPTALRAHAFRSGRAAATPGVRGRS
jgi:hypothetical protein